MFYEISETVLIFGLRYLHVDLFQFLHRFIDDDSNVHIEISEFNSMISLKEHVM